MSSDPTSYNVGPPLDGDPSEFISDTELLGNMPEEEYYTSQVVRNRKSYFETPKEKLFTQSFLPLEGEIKGTVYCTGADEHVRLRYHVPPTNFCFFLYNLCKFYWNVLIWVNNYEKCPRLNKVLVVFSSVPPIEIVSGSAPGCTCLTATVPTRAGCFRRSAWASPLGVTPFSPPIFSVTAAPTESAATWVCFFHFLFL